MYQHQRILVRQGASVRVLLENGEVMVQTCKGKYGF